MKDKPTTKSDSFEKFNHYYDLLYRDKDYAKETAYVIALLKNFDPAAKDLLELGFGTGNYTKHLIEAGYKITGLEKNKKMVKLAKAKSMPGFSPLVGDISSFTIKKKFDAVVSLFHVISYLTKNSEVISCLQDVGAHLKKRGLFIFDVWYTPAVYSQQPRNNSKRVEDDIYEITRVANPVIRSEENVVDVNYNLTITDKVTGVQEVLSETHSMRHFSTPEIKFIAKLSGFKLLHSEEFLTAKTPDADTWGVCYILQKK